MDKKTENNIVLPQGRLAGESKDNHIIDENSIDVKSDVSSIRTDFEDVKHQLKMKLNSTLTHLYVEYCRIKKKEQN